MPKPAPDYRTDVLDCSPNPGKLAHVVELILAMRACAKREAGLQWTQFFKGGWQTFEASAKKGWSRPWVTSQTLSVSHSQMVMSQVAGSLQGHMGNVQNSFSSFVTESSLPSPIRHQLHFINRKRAWFWTCPVSLSQNVPTVDKKTGKTHDVIKTVTVSDQVRKLAKDIIRKAFSLHNKPHFRHFQPQIDQRGCFVQDSHTSAHPLWLNLGLTTSGARINLPIHTNPHFLARQETCVLGNALAALEEKYNNKSNIKNQNEPCQSFSFIKTQHAQEADLLKKDNSQHNPHPTNWSIAKTIRLILSEDHTSLKVALATDMRSVFEHSLVTYIVKTPIVALDLGLCVLAATDQGDLLGCNWLSVLEKFDALLTSIAKHRQKLQLPVKSERYVYHTNRLRGYLKTEINRVFNRLVKVRAPGHLILEALDFSDSRLSRRLNRIIRNFGKGLITKKLQELEKQFGITHELRNPAYSSQECHACGYVDRRNRKTQSQFKCQFCKKTCHADVNGARVLRDRRSVTSSVSGSRYRVNATLIECVKRFNERYTRPRGGPADPRLTNPYFKDWPALVRSSGEEPFSSSLC